MSDNSQKAAKTHQGKNQRNREATNTDGGREREDGGRDGKGGKE